VYRPQIKVLDCTIRDGGLANDSHFPLETVRAVYKACCDSGIDYVELGYRNSKAMFDPDEFGPWRFCDEKDLRAATEGIENPGTKISVMMDAHKCDPADIIPCAESVVDTIRIATYVKDIDKAIRAENVAHENGYETTINVMAISIESDFDLDPALEQIEKETSVVACYVVDSFGALYSEQVDYLVEKYQRIMPTREVGIHMHNSQQLAFANTIEGIIKGFLKNPKFDLRPILDCVAHVIRPMQENLDWGYMIPYMITGILNQHPRSAMAVLKSADRDGYRAFYDKMLEAVE